MKDLTKEQLATYYFEQAPDAIMGHDFGDFITLPKNPIFELPDIKHVCNQCGKDAECIPEILSDVKFGRTKCRVCDADILDRDIDDWC